MKYSLFLFTIILLMSMSAPPLQSKKYLALGDSYTIGESVPEAERWPVQLVEALKKNGVAVADLKIIATTGWRTDNLKNAMDIAQLKPEYDLVSLLIGVNNQYQGRSVEQYKPEFQALLDEAVRLAKGKKENVFVVSIPDYGYTPFGKPKQAQVSAELDMYNRANEEITRRAGIQYIYITDISRRGLAEPDLVAADNLHPSGKMYALWVERIMKVLWVEK
jgi:lysophospholipase L1-like esterase